MTRTAKPSQQWSATVQRADEKPLKVKLCSFENIDHHGNPLPIKPGMVPELGGLAVNVPEHWETHKVFRRNGGSDLYIFGKTRTLYKMAVRGPQAAKLREGELIRIYKQIGSRAGGYTTEGTHESVTRKGAERLANFRVQRPISDPEKRIEMRASIVSRFQAQKDSGEISSQARFDPDSILPDLVEELDTYEDWRNACVELAEKDFPKLSKAKGEEEKIRAYYLDRLAAWGIEPPAEFTESNRGLVRNARKTFARRKGKLSEKKRLLMDWLEFTELTVAEVSAILGKSPEATKRAFNRLGIARKVPPHRRRT